MADIVNLRTARKRKGRADAAATASEKRIAHGRSGAEKVGTKLERAIREKRLDGHRRAPGDNNDPQDPDA